MYPDDEDDPEQGLRSSQHGKDASVLDDAMGPSDAYNPGHDDLEMSQSVASASRTTSSGSNRSNLLYSAEEGKGMERGSSNDISNNSNINTDRPYFPRSVSSYRPEPKLDETLWEDHPDVPVTRPSLNNQKKEIILVTILLIVGFSCTIAGIQRLSVHDKEGGAALMLVGLLTLIPGLYYAVMFVRAWRNGTLFRMWENNRR